MSSSRSAVSDTTGETIRGVATEVLTSTTPTLGQITMDLIDAMTVESVEVDGSSAPFLHTQDLLTVTLGTPIPEGESATVRVSYHGHPPQDGYGLYFDTHAGRSFIWTISEPSDARRWWPVKDRPDDKADSCRVRITAPVSMTATSNGRLESTAPGLSGTQVWTWVERHPIAPYLICVNAGDFEVVSDSWDRPGGGTMPIDSYVFPEQMGAAATDFSIAPGALSAFSERFGIYPFADEKYGITVFGWGGGMEHQTNTSYGHFLITGDHRYDWIYVHELSHQWWGDNVTCATWADTWLNEGFASWCEALWYEHEGGFGAYRDYMTQSQRVRDPSGPIYDYPDPFDGNTIYNKGAWAAHMLRGVLGDSVMFSALADYRVAYQNRSVTTEQLRASLEASSGRDLSWFFDEWIYGMNRPHYRVSSFAESHGSGQRVYVHLDQTQADPYFTMPVQIRVQAGVEEKTAVLFNDPDHEDLVVDLESGGPVSVTVDPDQWILRTVESGAYELNLITTALPAAATGASVSDTLVARGGTPPYSWQAIDALPAGIVLGLHDGVLSGTPTQDGDYAFRVEVWTARCRCRPMCRRSDGRSQPRPARRHRRHGWTDRSWKSRRIPPSIRAAGFLQQRRGAGGVRSLRPHGQTGGFGSIHELRRRERPFLEMGRSRGHGAACSGRDVLGTGSSRNFERRADRDGKGPAPSSLTDHTVPGSSSQGRAPGTGSLVFVRPVVSSVVRWCPRPVASSHVRSRPLQFGRIPARLVVPSCVDRFSEACVLRWSRTPRGPRRRPPRSTCR
ncbi:MAG: M1 family aminopeptidase [Candidatus Eisenbacteria bacterium]